MNELLKNQFFKSNVHSVISDRNCPAIEKAERHGVYHRIIRAPDTRAFCDLLLEYLHDNRIDFVFSFFTRLFAGDLLRAYEDRIINLHPSLLPAFKGLDGFGDAVRYGVRHVGTTIHFIDEEMDRGKIIMQSVCPLDTSRDLAFTRHRIFEQQCRSLLQVTRWLVDQRIAIEAGHVVVKGASFSDLEFSPSLDFEDAIRLRIPFAG